ncbi:hypothetical protein ASPZODRAFT_147267 [Penicilliopsis zonata CBS 506.65]|uniref:Uncharacterized protein n=1 Tax=Penicilliopsis zonata CBS 506.65 TaxID=1073090 RepID=A0A1L9S5J2_9EURO|nr:hypothetical protein ASPZODRAFT_147267 [Penicilliopsis zonata CBS 506.65]OJJ42428.1 hypothetical protein ASPZODRAFT_147267 [Penicilliopsis zonata CBS 506.65]
MSQATKAEHILDLVSITSIVQFIKRDWTGPVLDIPRNGNEHPSLTGFLVGRKWNANWESWGSLLLSYLSSRGLALKEKDWLSKQQKPPLLIQAHQIKDVIIPNCYGLRPEFIKALNLSPESRALDALRVGEKLLRIENALGVPGISLVLLPAITKFWHLHDDELLHLIEALQSKPHRHIVILANELNLWEWVGRYQKWHEKHTGEIPYT